LHPMVIKKTYYSSMVHSQDQLSRQIGEIPFKSQFTTRLRDPKKEQHYIGMGFCRRIHRGWMVFLGWTNVQSLLATHSRTSSRLLCMEQHGITATSQLNTLVGPVLPIFRLHSNCATGGLLGPLIIHGPSNAKYDIDLGPVFLTDYYHAEYFDIVESIMKPLAQGGNPKPASDNNLINGKMDFDCSTVASGDTTPCTKGAGFAKFKFTTGKTHRLRLINAGSEGIQRFSIDGHNMTVIANDFVPIVR